MAGTTITLTSEASDPDNDPIQYRFFLDNQPQTEWSSNPLWIWTTSKDDIGFHSIDVRVRDGKHNSDGDESKTAQFAINKPPNKPPVASDLSPDKQSPQVVGTTVTWTASASDPDGDDVLYKFILDNTANPLWSNNPVWTWVTSQSESGTHSVIVEVRDGYHTGSDGFDDHKEVKFDLYSQQNVLTKPTEPYTREIKGRLKYKGGNSVRAGADVKLQEIFEGNIFGVGSAVASRQDGTFSIIYSSDELRNPDNPYLVIQAFFEGSPFSDQVKIDNIGGQNNWVEIICSPR